MTEETGQRHNSNCVHDEDDGGIYVGKVDRYAHGHKDQEDIDPAGADNALGRLVEAKSDGRLRCLRIQERPLPFILRRRSWWRAVSGGMLDCPALRRS